MSGGLLIAALLTLPGSPITAQVGADRPSPPTRLIAFQPSGRAGEFRPPRPDLSGRPKGPLPPRLGPPQAVPPVLHGPPHSGPRGTPEREPSSDERDQRTTEALLAQARQAAPDRYCFALEQGAHIRPTPDGRSFYLVWFPKDSQRASRPPVIVGLHGSESWAFDELFLWQPYAAKRGYGVVAVQWWLGGPDTKASRSRP